MDEFQRTSVFIRGLFSTTVVPTRVLNFQCFNFDFPLVNYSLGLH